jgi:hypothetical protein
VVEGDIHSEKGMYSDRDFFKWRNDLSAAACETTPESIACTAIDSVPSLQRRGAV